MYQLDKIIVMCLLQIKYKPTFMLNTRPNIQAPGTYISLLIIMEPRTSQTLITN